MNFYNLQMPEVRAFRDIKNHPERVCAQEIGSLTFDPMPTWQPSVLD